MKVFNSVATREALDFTLLISKLRSMFAEGCEVPLRHSHKIAPATAGERTVLIMPAWQDGKYLGIKTVNIFPENASKRLPGLHSTYILYDANTGVPVAQIDGNEITSRRTAAASALAASYLAREESSRLVVLGAGRVGSLIPDAYRAVLPIKHISVWDQNPRAAEVLAVRLRTEGIDVEIVTDLAESVRRADVVSCATLATSPIVQGKWLSPGSHLDLIGSFTPQMREADDDCFKGANIFVDTNEAPQKSGDLLGPMSRDVISKSDVERTLQALCRTTTEGRKSKSERTVFKAVGTALEDLAAAMLVFEHTI